MSENEIWSYNPKVSIEMEKRKNCIHEFNLVFKNKTCFHLWGEFKILYQQCSFYPSLIFESLWVAFNEEWQTIVETRPIRATY